MSEGERPRSPWRRRLGRGALVVVAGLLAFAAVLIVDGWVAFGDGATGERLARMERSPQWDDGAFDNPQPLYNDVMGSLAAVFDGSDHATPDAPIPTVDHVPGRFAAPPASGLRLTWMGHSSVLIELEGARVLTDPIWGERASPFSWLGPRRWYAAPVPLAQLPELDAVLISHDHYDHLDHPTILALRDRTRRFVVPLGVGAHLAYWGVPPERIVELDWWERAPIAEGVEVVATPARHASGRQLIDQNATLWAGYALLGQQRRVFFSGDTGLFPDMKRIGRELGPFDVAMVEVGAYHAAWPDWHIGPEQAVLAHQWLRGKTFVPIHWGLFDLALHGWTEPIERTMVAAHEAGVRALTPRPGESFEPTEVEALERWWPEVPWQRAEDHPIRSTKVNREGP